MSMEVSLSTAICCRCGLQFRQRKGFFYVSYASSYKGTGYLPICSSCTEKMFLAYKSQCGNSERAIRQMCRKLDLYWSKAAYDSVVPISTESNIFVKYLSKLRTGTNVGKSYDDTLIEEGNLWNFNPQAINSPSQNGSESNESNSENNDTEPPIEIPEEVKTYWGKGYTPEMYKDLEDRRNYWMSHFPDGETPDIGTEALIRQICSLELDINRDRTAGKSVDKSITALNTLLGSANLRPAQKKTDDTDSSLVDTPLGVWLYRYENQRPLPDIDDDLKDVNKIKKYVFTWMGHLCKMMGIKNEYSRMYEDEMKKYSVNKPEYDGDDDEFMYTDEEIEQAEEMGEDDE